MTKHKYEVGRYYEWTEEDRKRGECPVPAGADVTVWFEDNDAFRRAAQCWDWDECEKSITGFLVLSYPKEPREVWVIFNPDGELFQTKSNKSDAERFIAGEKGWTIAEFREVPE